MSSIRQKKYYTKNRAAGLVRLSIWVRESDRVALAEWLDARGLSAPASRRKKPDDGDQFLFDFGDEIKQ